MDKLEITGKAGICNMQDRPDNRDAVLCPHTGIMYDIVTHHPEGVGCMVGMEYVLKHPLSHINVVRNNAVYYSKRTVGLSEAAGSILTILRHYGLLVVHPSNPAVVYKVNEALCMGYSRKALCGLVYKLLVQEKALSRVTVKQGEGEGKVVPMFDLGTVQACGHETGGQERYFVDCFKGWMADLLSVACIGQDNQGKLLEEQYKAKALEQAREAEVSKAFGSRYIKVIGGETLELEGRDKVDGVIVNVEDSIIREGRRKSQEYIVRKVKAQLLYCTRQGIITDKQYKQLLGYIRHNHVPAKIADYVLDRLYKWIWDNKEAIVKSRSKSGGNDVQRVMRIITIRAWFGVMLAGWKAGHMASGKLGAASFAIEGEGIGDVVMVGGSKDGDTGDTGGEKTEAKPGCMIDLTSLL